MTETTADRALAAAGARESPRAADPPQAAAPPQASVRTFRKWAYNQAMAVMRRLATIVARSSLVPTSPFMRDEDFPWAAPLNASWREIRRELDGVLTYRDALPAFHEINGDATNISHDDWKSFFLYGFGRASEANCRRCPRTAALIERVPGMKTAFFSILGPGIHLPPHRGPWKGFIRYHLGLIVPGPPEKLGIKVGDDVGHWEEGKSLIFDDTYVHSVWNDTGETRVVLFLDVERPCRFPGWLINRAVIWLASLSPFVRDSMRRHKLWERRFEKERAANALRDRLLPPSSSPAGAGDGPAVPGT